MTQTALSQRQSGINIGNLAREAGVALVIQFSGVALTYLVQVILARWMGRAEYGIYEYVVAWSLLLAIPAGLGLARTSLRLIPEYKVRQEWGLLRGIIRGSWWMTIVTGFLVALVSTGVILLINHYHSFTYAIPLLIGIWLVPLQALVQLQLETGRAIGDIILAYAPSLIIWPVLILCSGYIWLEKNHSLTSLPMITMATLMLLGVILVQLVLIRFKVKQEVEETPPVYSYRSWLGISLILLLQGAFVVILNQTDIVMVGSFLGPERAGMYSAAVKTAMWVSFVLQIVNMIAAPAFVTLYAQKDLKGLQEVVANVTVWIFWPSMILGIFLTFWSSLVLGIFGSSFTAVSWELKILVFGRVVDAFCGSVGCLIVMTGHQNKSITVFGSTALINVVLNAVLIPGLGSLGAAIATAFSMTVWNIWLSVLVVKLVGIRPSIFYTLFPNKEVNSN